MKKLLLLSALAVGPAASFAVTWNETEANDTLFTPNSFSLSVGDDVSGATTGSSTTTAGLGSADYFRLGFGAQTLAVYRNRMTLNPGSTAPTGNGGTLVGRTTATTITASNIQLSSTATSPARFNQWYSFGVAHSIDYRVTGVATSTAAYSSVYSQDTVTVGSLGTISAGMHNFSTLAAGTADTEIVVLDMSGNILETNDDTSSATTDSEVDINLVAGQSYYIAVGRYNTAGNVAANGVGVVEPGDFTSGSYYLNANMLASSSNSSGTYDLAVDGTSVATGAFVANTDAFRVDFYTVRAVPEPTSMAALGLGVAALARRRRNKK